MLKLLALLALLFCVSNAMVIGPKVYEQQDLGDYNQPTFLYSLSADCTAGTINVIISDENNTPVEGAQSYLKYIDFSEPLISSTVSDRNGLVVIKLPGSVNLMRGLFILVLEKHGFQDKEVHFDLSPCLAGYVVPPPPNNTPSNPPPAAVNSTAPPPSSPIEITVNTTGNSSTPANQSKSSPVSPISSVCPSALILLLVFKFSNTIGHP